MKIGTKSSKSIDSRFNYVICDFCNSNNYQILLKTKDYLYKFFSDDYYIVKCLNCNLVYTNPRYKKLELDKFYKNTGVFDNRPSIVRKRNRFDILLRKDILTEYFNYPFFKKKKLRKIIQYPNFLRIRRKWKKMHFVPRYKKNGRILDIGCSYGRYLYQFKKLGWNVKGIELSKEAVDYAVNKLKLDVINVNIEDFHSEKLYDYIYLLNVLEHIESPKNTLKKCYSILKPNGKIILSLPDFSGIEARLYRKYAYTIQAPYHLYHFSPRTIKNYLFELNFKNVKIIHNNFDRDLVAPLGYLLGDNPKYTIIKICFKLATNKFIRKILIKIIVDFLAFIGKTSRMTVAASK